MQLSKTSKKVVGTAQVTSRTFSGLLLAPIRLLSLLSTLFFALALLLILLVATKFLHDNYVSFQVELQTNHSFEMALTSLINVLIALINVFQIVLQFAVEIWDYTVPMLNLLVYIFYRIVVAIFLTIWQKDNNDNTSIPLKTPDPTSTLNGDTDTYMNMLECVLIDILTILAGIFKAVMQALAAMVMVVFDWLEQNLKRVWMRREYCRMGTNDPDWGTPTIDPESGQNVYSDGSGPGNTCPDNSEMIQSLISFCQLIIGIVRDVFIMVFPIIASLLKSLFDAILKILPQLMEGIVDIIELFGPTAPLGKFLMFLINFMIQTLGTFLRSCFLQLVLTFASCLFNGIIALVVNAIREVIKILLNIVCLGGLVCPTKVPGTSMAWPSCSFSSSDCNANNYDSYQRNVSQLCQVSQCTSMIYSAFKESHINMTRLSAHYPDSQDYRVAYHRTCVSKHSEIHNRREETVAAHLFCRFLSEDVHAPSPLGVEPSKAPNTFTTYGGENFCASIQSSCLCKYKSPICESQTCCVTYFSVLVQQILQDLEMENCDPWSSKQIFAHVHCVSRTQRSLDLGIKDMLGTSTHCEGFTSLVNASCFGKPAGTPIDIKGVVGGLCGWVDNAGFCDEYRRPEVHDPLVELVRQRYNEDIRKQETVSLSYSYEERSLRRVGRTSLASSYIHSAGGVQLQLLKNMRKRIRAVSDQYNVASYAMTRAFPIVSTAFLIRPILKTGIMGREGADNSNTFLMRDYDANEEIKWFRKRRQKQDWMDLMQGDEFVGAFLNGTNFRWRLGDTIVTDRPQNETDPFAYPPSLSACASTNNINNMYVQSNTFQCGNVRMQSTSDGVGGSLQNLIGTDMTQDKVDSMISQSSTPINQMTTERPTFSGPNNQYVTWMYNQNITSPATWSPSSANDPNQNPNWREPLTSKNDDSSYTNRPGSFTIYGSIGTTTQRQSSITLPLDKCPVPTDFPWERVFYPRKEETTNKRAGGNIKSFIKGLPEWVENNIPERVDPKVPPHVSQAVRLMYTRKLDGITGDVQNLLRSWDEMVYTWSAMSAHWDNVSKSNLSTTSRTNRYSWFAAPKVVDMYDDRAVRRMLLGDPQNTSTLCINRLLSPYECCTDTSSAYECCFGLVGCLPPPKLIQIDPIIDLSFITQATCSGSGNVVLSLFAIPRLLLSSWGWTIIFLAPPWARLLIFRLLFPIIYDYGGLGMVSHQFLSDLFCFVVNSYYLILIILVCMGVYVLDVVFFGLWRDLTTKTEVALASVDAADAKEYAQQNVDIINTRLIKLETTVFAQ